MDWFQRLCLAFLMVIIASAAYGSGFYKRLDRGCQLTRDLYEQEKYKDVDFDAQPEEIDRELEEVERELKGWEQ